MANAATTEHPTVNLNGTSKDDLFQQFFRVHKAARGLLTTLQEATPHGRDYPNGGYETALENHSARYAAVNDIIAWAESQVDHLYK